MKKPRRITIICLGNWNKKIFNPGWIDLHLFDKKNTPNEIEGLISPQDLEFGFKFNNISLFPKDTALEIELNNFDNQTKQYACDILIRILESLPHTPIRAIGFNIRFEFSKSDKNELVEALRNNSCSLPNFMLTQSKFSKDYDDFQLNIIADNLKDKYLVNFNFHFTDFKSFSKDTISDQIEIAKKIII